VNLVSFLSVKYRAKYLIVMPRFQQGQSGNPYGRPKGSKNMSTNELRKLIKDILSQSYSNRLIKSDLKELTAKERLDFLFKMLNFVLPKPLAEAVKEDQHEKLSASSWIQTMNRLVELTEENKKLKKELDHFNLKQ